MPLTLGAGWPPPRVIEQEKHDVSIESLQTEMLLSALNRLHDALAQMPAPVVHVSEPDLTDIVTAVNGIKGPAGAGEIAAAIRAELAGGEQPAVEPVLKKLTEALERLDFRLKGLNVATGGPVAPRVQETREVATEARYEWQLASGSSVPLYIGTAPPGTTTSGADWKIDKYTYTAGPAGDAVPSLVQTATGAWDSRASLF